MSNEEHEMSSEGTRTLRQHPDAVAARMRIIV